jgi:hypothetical protein|uniref:Uncharacterized protein n=1 Tax=viral metagenome TaxID=1070528 RepID=A0A6C0CL63_9ZZZZ
MKNIHENIFYGALYLSYILYFVTYFQIAQYNPKYNELLEIFMKFYVILFLLIRFNPFVKSTFTEFDRTVVFSSAIFLLATTTFSELAEKFDLTELVKLSKLAK